MAGVAGALERTCVRFDEKGDRTGVTEDSFEQSFGPYMQLEGTNFLLGLLNGGGPASGEIGR